MLLSMIFTKLQRTKHDMKQFINRNNAYGSKVVSHTITKSLINQGDPMA
jgi:predicted transcriptional regulator